MKTENGEMVLTDNEIRLMTAINDGQEDISEILDSCDDIDLNCHNELGKAPIHMAAELGRNDIIRTLVERGVDVNSESERENIYFEDEEAMDDALDDGSYEDPNRTPLHFAAKYGHHETISTLIELEADVNKEDEGEHTPIHIAAKYGHEAVINLLLEAESEIDCLDENGRTPLHVAACFGHNDIIRILSDNNADIDNKDCEEQTPFFEAAELQNISTMRLLIELGANINTSDCNGISSMKNAALHGNTEVIKVLKGFGAVIDEDEGLIVKDPENITLLVSEGVSPENLRMLLPEGPENEIDPVAIARAIKAEAIEEGLRLQEIKRGNEEEVRQKITKTFCASTNPTARKTIALSDGTVVTKETVLPEEIIREEIGSFLAINDIPKLALLVAPGTQAHNQTTQLLENYRAALWGKGSDEFPVSAKFQYDVLEKLDAHMDQRKNSESYKRQMEETPTAAVAVDDAKEAPKTAVAVDDAKELPASSVSVAGSSGEPLQKRQRTHE